MYKNYNDITKLLNVTIRLVFKTKLSNRLWLCSTIGGDEGKVTNEGQQLHQRAGRDTGSGLL